MVLLSALEPSNHGKSIFGRGTFGFLLATMGNTGGGGAENGKEKIHLTSGERVFYSDLAGDDKSRAKGC